MSNRTCGTCHECCVHVKVDAFHKPAGTRCEHLLPVVNACGQCGIYADRPSECQQYTCSWIEGLLPEELKPEATGLLLETARISWPKPLVMLAGFEHKPGAIDKYAEQLDAAAVDGTVILMVPYDRSEPTLFGTSDDLWAYMQFMELCRRRGSVTHVYNDGVVEQEIPR